MKKNYFLTIFSLLFCFAIQAQVSYSGNTNSGFGGPIGNASMTINDDGTTITFTFTKGGGDFNDSMAMYISTGATGRNVIDGNVNDTADGLRRAISNTGSGDLTLPSGFNATHGVGINTGFGGLWSIPATGSIGLNGLVFVDAVGNPATNTTASFTFSFDWTEIGLTNTDKFDFVITYGNPNDGGTNMFSSDEAFGDVTAGNPGLAAYSVTSDKSYPNTWTGTTDTDWTTATNWTEGVPSSTDNVYIPMVTNQPTAAAAVTINKAIIKSGASVIAQDAFMGTITYEQSISDSNWHLIASPVVGEQYNDAWVTANSIPTGTEDTSNRAIATYDNGTPDTTDSDGAGTTDSATGYWRYFQGGTDVTFGAGVGYSLKRSASGNYTFTGTYPDGTITPAISQDDNNWNLIGNPYPSYLNIATFISDNTANLGAGAFQSIYVWNAGTSSYDDLQTGHVHPGQAFFINSNVASGNASITEAMQSHQTGITFYKNADPSIELSLSNGTISKRTKINYLDGKTTSLDPGFDIGMFDGVSSDLRVYTNLVNNNEGIAFARQALPNSDIETMVIPVGLIAKAGEISFSASALNLPANMKVFLEDRNTNTFTRLDEANSEYKVTLTENLDGIGRFYLHTKSSALNIDNVNLENVSIYKSDNSTLRIVGLPQGKSNVKMFTISGKQVFKTSFNSNGVSEINLPQLSTGIYIVQLNNENGKLNKKIVLE